jgi:hypothetical protein
VGAVAVGVSVLRGEAPQIGYGYGSGYGDGDGSGYGDGYGYGDDLVASSPSPETVTADRIAKAGACDSEVRKFARLFPDGGRWPDDIEKAKAAGLDVSWVTKNLGLLPAIPAPALDGSPGGRWPRARKGAGR